MDDFDDLLVLSPTQDDQFYVEADDQSDLHNIAENIRTRRSSSRLQETAASILSENDDDVYASAAFNIIAPRPDLVTVESLENSTMKTSSRDMSKEDTDALQWQNLNMDDSRDPNLINPTNSICNQEQKKFKDSSSIIELSLDDDPPVETISNSASQHSTVLRESVNSSDDGDHELFFDFVENQDESQEQTGDVERMTSDDILDELVLSSPRTESHILPSIVSPYTFHRRELSKISEISQQSTDHIAASSVTDENAPEEEEEVEGIILEKEEDMYTPVDIHLKTFMEEDTRVAVVDQDQNDDVNTGVDAIETESSWLNDVEQQDHQEVGVNDNGIPASINVVKRRESVVAEEMMVSPSFEEFAGFDQAGQDDDFAAFEIAHSSNPTPQESIIQEEHVFTEETHTVKENPGMVEYRQRASYLLSHLLPLSPVELNKLTEMDKHAMTPLEEYIYVFGR